MFIPAWLIIVAVTLIAFLYFKKNKSLTKKQDSYLVNLSIELNVDKINDFINNHESIKDKLLTEDDKEGDWRDTAVKKIYNIDILPNGINDIFFHRSKNTFSHLVSGYDCFDGEDKKTNKYIKNNTTIKKFSWERWREFISVDVTILDKKKELICIPIILVPIQELVHLMINGKFKDLNSRDVKREKIKVPISFESHTSNSKPKEFIEVWKSTGGTGNWISYCNALATVSATVPTECGEEY